jgi:hypothetical protein
MAIVLAVLAVVAASADGLMNNGWYEVEGYFCRSEK